MNDECPDGINVLDIGVAKTKANYNQLNGIRRLIIRCFHYVPDIAKHKTVCKSLYAQYHRAHSIFLCYSGVVPVGMQGIDYHWLTRSRHRESDISSGRALTISIVYGYMCLELLVIILELYQMGQSPCSRVCYFRTLILCRRSLDTIYHII